MGHQFAAYIRNIGFKGLAATLLLLPLLLCPFKANPAPGDSVLIVPFDWASQGSILLRASVNRKPALLILDTGSTFTVLRSEVLGRSNLSPSTPAAAGAGFSGEAVGEEVALELGGRKFEKRPVAVMNLSRVLSVYSEKIDGLLGLDFLRQFSQVTVNVKNRTITFISEARADSEIGLLTTPAVEGRPSYLKNLSFVGGDGHYSLNGVDLIRIPGDSIDLTTQNEAYKIRITFLKTVLVARGEPIDNNNQGLVKDWSKRIPLVAEILKDHDLMGSLKPLIYDPIEPKAHQDLQLQEELVLLWSADPSDSTKIGDTLLPPPIPFSSPIADVQYRGLNPQLFGKAYLQIVHLRDHSNHLLLGGFVIVSKPSGEYEFHLVPLDLLEGIVAPRDRAK